MKKTGKENDLQLVWKLSIPAILAQITSIVMQYIDAGMVGKMGAQASASIGLVSSSTWLLGGFCSAVSAGFSVQVAHCIGAKDIPKARRIFKSAVFVALAFSIMLLAIGAGVSGGLPAWLGGEKAIWKDATYYFLIYACSLPFMQMNNLAGGMLQCSGNMKIPSILNSGMCLLDVIFNLFLIFPTRELDLAGITICVPGMGLGVAGAALGTALDQVVTACLMMWSACIHSPILKLQKQDRWRCDPHVLSRAVRIAAPMALEHAAICGAMVMTTRIVAPLGTIAIAANSFAVTAESLCYMPGYGIAAAATTLVGQSIGAGNKVRAKKFAWMTVLFGMGIMTITGAVMYVIAPFLFQILTPDVQVQALGVSVLRIEVFAEPLYGASIVASGALRGAGDTFIPSILNLASIWGVRLSLSVLLAVPFGLHGVWIAMCMELCVRGSLFLIRLKRGSWLKRI